MRVVYSVKVDGGIIRIFWHGHFNPSIHPIKHKNEPINNLLTVVSYSRAVRIKMQSGHLVKTSRQFCSNVFHGLVQFIQQVV